jgi:hypothetical protein
MPRPRITATDSNSSSTTLSRRGATLLLLALMLQLLAVPIHLAAHHHHHHGGTPAPSDRDLARWDDPRGACHGDSEHEHDARDHLVPMLGPTPTQGGNTPGTASLTVAPTPVSNPSLAPTARRVDSALASLRPHPPRRRANARAPPLG